MMGSQAVRWTVGTLVTQMNRHTHTHRYMYHLYILINSYIYPSTRYVSTFLCACIAALYVCTQIPIYTDIQVYMFVHSSLDKWIYTCIHTYMYVPSLHTYKYLYLSTYHTYIYVYACTAAIYMQTQIFRYRDIYVYMYVQTRSQMDRQINRKFVSLPR